MRAAATATELATVIVRALISASKPPRAWTPSLEQTLHRLGCRHSLTPQLVARVIDSLPHHSLALGFFNWTSQQPNFTHTPTTYHSILKFLSLSRQFSAVESLFKQIKNQKVALDSSSYGYVISSLLLNKKTQYAFLVYNEVRKLGLDIGAKTWNSLLAALASDGYLDNARVLFDEMVGRGVSFNTLGFGVFVWQFSKKAEMNEILRLLDEVRRKDGSDVNGSVIAVLIVHGICQGSRLAEAFWILDELRRKGCKPDFMAYRVVAESYRAVGDVVEMEKVLKKKRKFGVAPRAIDYKEFILDLILERRMWEAKELGEVIVSGNFPVEDDVLNSLIGSVSAFDLDSALAFFDFMVGKGRSPSLLTLSKLSKILLKHGKFEAVMEVFQRLSSNGYFSDEESYKLMVSLLCKGGRVREAYAALQEMKKKGFVPDVSFYNSLMEACCNEDLLRPARRLWDEMFACGCDGNLETYKILICKFSEMGQVEEAERLFHHMLGKGLKPDSMIYTRVLGGLCQEAKLDVAFEIFNNSVKQDMTLARTILSAFVLHLCHNGYHIAASELLCGLSYEVGHSDSHVVLLKYLADVGEIATAIKHIRYVREAKPSILQIIFSELATVLSSCSKPENILQIFEAMPKNCQLSNGYAWKNLCNN